MITCQNSLKKGKLIVIARAPGNYDLCQQLAALSSQLFIINPNSIEVVDSGLQAG